MTPRQFVLDPAGALILLYGDGTIRREVPTGDHGGPATEWKDIDAPDGETVVEIAADGRAGFTLIVRTLSGRIYRQKHLNVYQPKVISWVAVELPQ